MNRRALHFLLDAAICAAALAVVLNAFALWWEIERTEQAVAQLQEAVQDAHIAVRVEHGKGCVAIPDIYRVDAPLSRELQEALHNACQEFGVRYELALAVIERETNFTNVIGDSGESVGYFQCQPRWWGGLMEEIGVDDLTDPAQNFRTGCAILASLMDWYGNETDAMTAYNSGHPGESEYAAAVMSNATHWTTVSDPLMGHFERSVKIDEFTNDRDSNGPIIGTDDCHN